MARTNLLQSLSDDELLHQLSALVQHQIEELVAELAPKPDVPATIRQLPIPRVQAPQLRPERVAPPATNPAPPVPPAPPPKLEPLALERYKVSFTASAALRDKLERLQALMDGDLVAVIEAAVTEKLERLEAKRYGAANRPRNSLGESNTWPSSRYIPAPLRRIVSTRDCNQCAFVDGSGRRCTERRGLEFHHDDPFGRGGDHDPAKVRLLCKTHNLFLAERDYGKDVIESYRRGAGRVSESPPDYGFLKRPLYTEAHPEAAVT